MGRSLSLGANDWLQMSAAFCGDKTGPKLEPKVKPFESAARTCPHHLQQVDQRALLLNLLAHLFARAAINLYDRSERRLGNCCDSNVLSERHPICAGLRPRRRAEERGIRSCRRRVLFIQIVARIAFADNDADLPATFPCSLQVPANSTGEPKATTRLQIHSQSLGAGPN